MKQIFKKIGEFMKRPLFLRQSDDGSIGGTATPPPAPKPIIPQEMYSQQTLSELREEIKKDILREYDIEKQKEEQKKKDKELEQLRKEKKEFEERFAEMEKQAKIDEYNNSFKDLAIKEGATKIEQLLKLANTELTPEEAVKTLKNDIPELFVKAPTINDIGGGIKGNSTDELSAEDIGKMSITEYKKWRKENV